MRGHFTAYWHLMISKYIAMYPYIAMYHTTRPVWVEQMAGFESSILNDFHKLYFAIGTFKMSNVESTFDKWQDQTIKYEFVTKTRAHAEFMFDSKQVGCSFCLIVMSLASGFTAPDVSSQHSQKPPCQWHGAIKS